MRTIVFVLAVIVFIVLMAVMMIRSGKAQGKVKAVEKPAARMAQNGPEPDPQRLQDLRKKLLHSEKQLWELSHAGPYEQLFEQSALSLQSLLGLAACSAEMMTEEKMEYYMWEVIAGPLLSGIRKAGGKIEQGVITLPEPAEKFEEDKIRKNLERLSWQEAEKYIRENELQIKAGEIALQKAAVIRELGDVAKGMEHLSQAGQAGKDDIGRLAWSVKLILEKHKIYPMSAADARLEPVLKKRFSPANECSLRYPGLFIQRDGAWEVLGADIGVDDRGV